MPIPVRAAVLLSCDTSLFYSFYYFNSFRNKFLLLVLHLFVLIAAVACCKTRDIKRPPCSKSKARSFARKTASSSSITTSQRKPRLKLPEPAKIASLPNCGGPNCPPCPPPIYQCPPNRMCKRCKSAKRPCHKKKAFAPKRFIEPFTTYSAQRPPPPCPK